MRTLPLRRVATNSDAIVTSMGCPLLASHPAAAGETCALLLATVGREPSDAAAVRSDAGADRWAAASVGIAQAAAAPKKTIPISPRNGEVSEKAASGSRDDGLSGPCEDRSEPPERTTVLEGLSGRPMGVYSRVPEGQKTNSVLLPSSCRGSELANHYHL